MHILTVLVAVIGILIFPALRRSKASEEDDCVGLFVGSARPLPAAPRWREAGTSLAAPRSGLS